MNSKLPFVPTEHVGAFSTCNVTLLDNNKHNFTRVWEERVIKVHQKLEVLMNEKVDSMIKTLGNNPDEYHTKLCYYLRWLVNSIGIWEIKLELLLSAPSTHSWWAIQPVNNSAVTNQPVNNSAVTNYGALYAQSQFYQVYPTGQQWQAYPTGQQWVSERIFPVSSEKFTSATWNHRLFGAIKPNQLSEFWLVLPSKHTIDFLNDVNRYCIEMDEFVKGTYL